LVHFYLKFKVQVNQLLAQPRYDSRGDSEVDLTPATTMAIAAGGSITPFRGAVTLTTGKLSPKVLFMVSKVNQSLMVLLPKVLLLV